MNLLFFDTYYLDGNETPMSIYNFIKDFLVPLFGVGIPIWVTFLITKKDRKINAENRKFDFENAEIEKLNAWKTTISKEFDRKKQVLDDLEFFNQSAIINLEQHLITLKRLLKKLNFDQLPTFSVQVFTNEYISSIMSLNFNDIRPYMEQAHYVKYINSLKLLEGLYKELDRIMSNYSQNHFNLHNNLDVITHKLFFIIQKNGFDQKFDKIILKDLLKFKSEYDNYVSNYSSVFSDPSYASALEKLKIHFINENFLTKIDEFPELKSIVIDFECILVSLERLVNYYSEALNEINSGFIKNTEILKSFKLIARPIDLSPESPKN